MANWQITSAFAAMLTAFGWGNAVAANQPHHVAADLIATTSAAVPGKTLTVALRERIEPGWHTYWANPGDSGEPTSIEWALPEGVKAGPVLWALPHVVPVGPLVEYGYDDEVLLLTEIEVPAGASGSIKLAAKVSYLVCKDICIPEETHVELTLPVASDAAPSEGAGEIAKARAALPKPLPGSANYAVNPGKGALRLTVTAEPALFEGMTEARFFPLAWGSVSNPAAQPSKLSNGELILDLQQGDTKETPAKLEGVLIVTKGKSERTGYTISAARGPDSASAGELFDHTDGAGQVNSGGHAAASEAVSGSAGIAVLFAFLGGIILNLMPCVFPVLALKALGFAKAADGGHRQQGIAYLGGVLASFAALALVIAVLRQGSVALGWGFQFQSPAFVLGLALLFFVMGLSLSGVVSFGGGLMSIGDSLSRKPGNAGYFFTGVLAAVAATPCTAPFMGAAIGFAMTQSILVLVAVMLALGTGFAAPVVALSFSPAMQKILPKPGAWMETLKQVLAFPLYATAAWLVWVLSIQTGSDGVMAAALGVVGVGFAAWLAGKTATSSLPVKLGGAGARRGGRSTWAYARDDGADRKRSVGGRVLRAEGGAVHASQARRAEGAGAARVREPHRGVVHHLQGERADGAQIERGGAGVPGGRDHLSQGRLDQGQPRDHRASGAFRPRRRSALSVLSGAWGEPARSASDFDGRPCARRDQDAGGRFECRAGQRSLSRC